MPLTLQAQMTNVPSVRCTHSHHGLSLIPTEHHVTPSPSPVHPARSPDSFIGKSARAQDDQEIIPSTKHHVHSIPFLVTARLAQAERFLSSLAE